jgi:hypothetical protein
VPIGIEMRILRDEGALLMSRIFRNKEEALQWAEEQKEEWIGNGWTPA